MSLYSSVCHKDINDACIFTLGVPSSSCAAIYAVALFLKACSVISSLSPNVSDKLIIAAFWCPTLPAIVSGNTFSSSVTTMSLLSVLPFASVVSSVYIAYGNICV